jgi:hypothetical protein
LGDVGEGSVALGFAAVCGAIIAYNVTRAERADRPAEPAPASSI